MPNRPLVARILSGGHKIQQTVSAGNFRIVGDHKKFHAHTCGQITIVNMKKMLQNETA